MTYSEKLKSPKWLRKKYVILERDNYTCQSCLTTEKQLHVHHTYYTVGKEPWDYPNESLITYCEVCHNTHHILSETLKRDLIDFINQDKIHIKPIAQLCILIDSLESFNQNLSNFLNEQMEFYIKSKKRNNG